jgi:hypothetical protein
MKETLSQTKMASDRVFVTDCLTFWPNSGLIFRAPNSNCDYLCLFFGSVGVSVAVNLMEKCDGGNAPQGTIGERQLSNDCFCLWPVSNTDAKGLGTASHNTFFNLAQFFKFYLTCSITSNLHVMLNFQILLNF